MAALPDGILRARLSVVATLVGALLFSGCVSDTAPSGPGMTIIEAHEIALDAARELDSTAHLIAFVGHEGPAPEFVGGYLSPYIVMRDTSADDRRGDGRALAWAILFATSQGALIRAEVHADRAGDPLVEGLQPGGDNFLRALWALNLGGRLIVDSPRAMAIAHGDAGTASLMALQPGLTVTYASSVVQVGATQGERDLVHDIYLDYTAGPNGAYGRYVQVTHWDGRLVAAGAVKAEPSAQPRLLFDETIPLSPAAPVIRTTLDIPVALRDVRYELTASGVGNFSFTVTGDERNLIREEGLVTVAPVAREGDVGYVGAGNYTVLAQGAGKVDLTLRVYGVVGI